MNTAAATAGEAPGRVPGAGAGTGVVPPQRTAAPDGPSVAADGAPAAVRDRLRHTAHRLRERTAPLRVPRLDPYWTAGFFFLAYTVLACWHFRTLSTSSWDLGIFEQAIRGYAHFGAPIVDLKGPGTNILGDHFSPVLVLLAPLYRLFPSSLTLLIAQAALFALSVLPVTRAAARSLGRLTGLAIGIAYGLSWGVQKAVDFDFHEIAFALPLIAFALEAVLRGRWTAVVCWAAPLVLVKEDLGVTAATIGALALIRTRRASPLAIGLVAFGLSATAVTLGVLIPGFNGSGSYDYWSKFGAEGGGAAIPLVTAVRTTLWVLLPTTGLLALRSPLLLVALPTLGWRFLSHEPHYWGIDWHYNAVLMPVVFLALIDALPRIRVSARPWLRSYAHHLPAAVLATALALTTTLPLSRLTEAATYRTPPAAIAAEKLLDHIPDGATVESDIRPLSRLTGRTRVFWTGDTGGLSPDYVAVQLHADRTPRQMLKEAMARHPRSTYVLLGGTGDLLVFHRTSAR
ncbi:putative membrane protein [Streptomyces sp. 2333.5]|uniref:DUF2079 domain-containing protein n=1 Tax=unclassified Streptomyces TaxID=2593676 RepID=UPI00089CBE57|nr:MULTISPECIES: DUF2079 domain-containing protein [unclassified Streptomyces]PJJ02424.1 putative membrane protein [Streptomyces sp. 2333.5]SED09517.1 Uncharacterized membrane protein [Streptomyces sp. 2314.4]SED96484.1 Uncharacterized membrane protein [Streptomyces sp. 2112.2]